MDEARYETLLDENTNLKKALSSTKHVLERTLNDYETLRLIHEDFKGQYDKLRRESDEAHQKYFQLLADKKEVEAQFDNTIRNFKNAIEQKQRELEDVQAKVIPSLDYDMMRIKIINELEGPQRLALETKQQEMDRLQDLVYELKRQVEIFNSKYDAIKYEAEKDIRDLKERHKLEINELMLEIQALQERADDNRDKEVIRHMRRELDELRFRYGENENEMEELIREKDRLREEKNDILIKLNKQVEVEKSDKRHLKAENDKLIIRIRQLENEASTVNDRFADRQHEASRLQKENEKLQHDNENKLKQIHGLQSQLRDLEDGQYSAQAKLQEYISQSQLQNHEKHISEKNRIATLQREIESYQKTIVELENKHRTTNFQTGKDLDIAKQELSRVNELYYQTQRNVETKEEEVNRLKRDLENTHDEMYYLQRKTKELTLQKDSASPATALGQRGVGKDSELLREALNREEKLKNKVINLKAKLRAANKKIMELLPHKILAQKDAGNILKENIGFSQNVGPLYPPSNPGNVIENLKNKYGIIDNYGPIVDAQPAPVTDVKAISAKYGFGLGAAPAGQIDSFQPEIDRLVGKYGFEPLGRPVVPGGENALQSEIERSADEAIKKYGL